MLVAKGNSSKDACLKFIFHHCIDNDIITKFQSGYLPGDSTVSQLMALYDIILEALDGGKSVNIFLDVSRAFDRVWHKGLRSQLNAIGIRGRLLK